MGDDDARAASGVYPARFGNVYAASQLGPLFDRALQLCRPAELPWPYKDGVVNPFRPFVRPNPFPSAEALAAIVPSISRRRGACSPRSTYSCSRWA